MKDTRKVFKSGLFVGTEVERTPFVGKHTLFVSDGHRLEEARDQMLASKIPHLYIGFRLGRHMTEATVTVLKVARVLLAHGCFVTVDVNQAAEAWATFWRGLNTLRREYSTFCLLYTVELPFPDNGGYAIKVEPPKIFSEKAYETGVYVSNPDMREYTPWSAYVNDKELEK